MAVGSLIISGLQIKKKQTQTPLLHTLNTHTQIKRTHTPTYAHTHTQKYAHTYTYIGRAKQTHTEITPK